MLGCYLLKYIYIYLPHLIFHFRGLHLHACWTICHSSACLGVSGLFSSCASILFFPLYFSSLDNSYRFSFKFTFFFFFTALSSLLKCQLKFVISNVVFFLSNDPVWPRSEVAVGSCRASTSSPHPCRIAYGRFETQHLFHLGVGFYWLFHLSKIFPPLLVCVSSFCWMKVIKRRIVDTEVKHIHAQKGHAPSPGSSLACRVESTRPLARSRLDVAVVTLGAPQTRIPPPASRCGPVPCAGSAAWELSGSLFHP